MRPIRIDCNTSRLFIEVSTCGANFRDIFLEVGGLIYQADDYADGRVLFLLDDAIHSLPYARYNGTIKFKSGKCKDKCLPFLIGEKCVIGNVITNENKEGCGCDV